MSKLTDLAIDKLAAQFDDLDLTFHEYKAGKIGDVISFFPGSEDEDIMICVFKGTYIHEPFHRQDFFFVNFAYHNSYEALSANSNDKITIHENECYISQPYCGYALRVESDKPSTIIGVLIRREAFFREYLSALSRDSTMFRFLLDPQTNRFSDEFIHLSFTEDHAVRSLLENMAAEYADKKEDTQSILKPMTLALLLYIARRYRMQKSENEQLSVTDQITRYISDHVDNVTLGELSKHFSYHTNYISALIHKETGKTFKQLVLEERMSRAIILMKNTTLSNEEMVIACSNGCHCRTCLRIAIIKRNNCKSVKSDRISEDCFDLFHSVFQRSSTYPHRTKTERRWFKPQVFGGDTQVNLTVIGGSRTLHLMTRKHAQKQEHGSLFPCYIILFCGCVPESMRMHHFTDAVL